MDTLFLTNGQNKHIADVLNLGTNEGRRSKAKLTDAFKDCSNLYDKVGKTYDDLPYDNHIKMVAVTAMRHFSDQTAEEQIDMLIACFGHDLIEDARVSYNELKVKYGERVAELIYSVTDNTGRTRAERACYEKIRTCVDATYLKLCDRYANSLYSYLTGSRMYQMYKDEYALFRSELYTENAKTKTLWIALDLLLGFFNTADVPLYS